MGVVEILRERMIKELVETTSALKTVEFIITLLKTTDFSISRIATITGVTKAFVTKIKEDKTFKIFVYENK